MVPASKERDKHVNRKPQTATGAVLEVSKGAKRKGYPIPRRAEDENLSAKVLKFKLSLKGNIKFSGQTTWERRRDIMHKVWKPDKMALLETRNSSMGLAQRLHWWV